MSDRSYNTAIYEKQGGSELVVGTGGQITLDGGAIKDASGNVLLSATAAFTGFKQIKVTGHTGAGACTATGAAVGDRVVAIFGHPAAGGDLIVPALGVDFESTISVLNQIQQLSASDLHLDSFVLLLIPAA